MSLLGDLLDQSIGTGKKKGKDPAHVVRYRIETAYFVVERLYGHKLKRWPRDSITRWAHLCAAYPRRGKLTYRLVYELAKEKAEELHAREDWKPEVLYDERVDWKLWQWFREELRECSARWMDTPEGQRNYEEFDAGKWQGALIQATKDALEKGLCPICLGNVREGDDCGHGYGRPELDRENRRWLVDG